MSFALFTANRTGELLLDILKGTSLRPKVITYARGAQRTGLASDLSRFTDDFRMTFITDNSAERCADINALTEGMLPVCIDWTKDFFNGVTYPVVYSHPSLLPMYRGYSAVTEQFERGVSIGGASFYLRNEKIDGGDIIRQEKIRLGFDMYPDDFFHIYAETCAKFLIDLDANGLSGFTTAQQDDMEAVYLQRKRTRDALIDFNRDAFSLYNHIRAYSRPFFGAYFISGGRKVTVWRAITEKWQGDYGEPGTILDMSINGTEIACGSGTIVITETDGMIWDDAAIGQKI